MEPIFNINYDKWKLLNHHDTGLPTDPVPAEKFDHYTYWDNKNHKPVRQIIEKDGSSNYGDFLNEETGVLERRVSITLDISPSDDEISEEEYYELCQLIMLKDRLNRIVNWRPIRPFPSFPDYFREEEQLFVRKSSSYFYLDLDKRILRRKRWAKPKNQITEYEFYYYAVDELINRLGKSFVLGNKIS